MPDKRKFNYTRQDYQKKKSNLYDAEAEAHLSFFARRVHEIRPEISYNTICRDMIIAYLAKNVKKDGVTPTNISGPTPFMRQVIGKK